MSSSRGGRAPAQTGELVNIINKLRERLKSYRDELAKNEMLVRYCIVDPLLRALGWDLEDPNQVVPEYTGRRRKRPDYLLYDAEGRPLAAIEVKALGKVEEAEKDVFRVAKATRVKFIVITDGGSWHLYSSSQRLEEPPLFKWNLLEGSSEEVARVVQVIANTESFGKPGAEISLRPPPALRLKCPYCGFVGEFRLLRTWRYRVWDVYYYECPKCGGRFRWQVDPSGRYKSYVLRVGSRAGG